MKAKVLSANDIRCALASLSSGRHVDRDRVIVLLSFKAGMRACEISGLTWAMVTNGRGGISGHIEITAEISKYGSARRIPLNPELKRALVVLAKTSGGCSGPVVRSERGGHMTAKSIVNWFARLYDDLGLEGCSSHSGRRTFVTRAARLIAKSGGSLRDLQQLVGHRSITTTQRYIDGDSDAQRRLIRLL